MGKWTGLRPSPALLVGMIALTMAVAGSATALPGSAKITKSTVKKTAKKVANKEITKRAAGLTVAKAASADQATTAATAETANVLSSQKILNYQSAVGGGETEVFSGGGFRFVATCAAGPALTLTATTSTDNATINAYGNNADTEDDDWDISEPKVISDDDEQRDVTMSSASGAFVTVEYAANQGTLYGGAASCMVKGLAQTG